MPEVSVILISYNHAAFIGEAIESVLAQTFDDWELLVIDDASRDSSPEIIRQYQCRDSRIRTVFHDRNQKTARTVNEGFALAQGRYLMIMCSDDVIPYERLRHQVDLIQSPGNENKVIIGRWYDMDSHGNVLPNPYYGSTWEGFELKRHGDIFESLALAGVTYVGMQMLLLTRGHVAAVCFDERFPLITHEYKFALDLASRFLFHEMEEIVYIHRIHGDNLSCAWDQELSFHEKAQVARELLEQYGHRLSGMAQKRQLNYVLYDALRQQDLPALRSYFLKHLTLHPDLLQVVKDHYRHHREGEIPLPCSPMEGIPRYTLADTGITLADLEAIGEPVKPVSLEHVDT